MEAAASRARISAAHEPPMFRQRCSAVRRVSEPSSKNPCMSHLIYKIVSAVAWREAASAGMVEGAPIDRQDGFIHLSAADQVRETAARHFAGQDDLTLLAVDPEALGDRLQWEPSRGGALFPHLYGPLSTDAVRWTASLPLDADGRHRFPDGVA